MFAQVASDAVAVFSALICATGCGGACEFATRKGLWGDFGGYGAKLGEMCTSDQVPLVSGTKVPVLPRR